MTDDRMFPDRSLMGGLSDVMTVSLGLASIVSSIALRQPLNLVPICWENWPIMPSEFIP